MKSSIIAFVIAAAFAGQSQAGGAPKAGSFNPSCVRFYTVGSTDTCSSVATSYGITTTQLFSWNPKLHTTCDNLDDGSIVCVSLTGAATTDAAGSHSGATPAVSSAAPAASSAAASAKTSKAASAPASAAASVSAAAPSVSVASAAASAAAGSSTIAAASAENSTASSAPSASVSVSAAKSAGTREQVSVALLLGAVAAVGALVL